MNDDDPDDDCPDIIPFTGGTQLSPARRALGDAYDAHLDRLSQRYALEVPQREPRATKPYGEKFREHKLPYENWPDLKLCNCADCGCLLLGESQEHLRELRRGRPKVLPGPVAGRRDGRPFCEECLGRQDEV